MTPLSPFEFSFDGNAIIEASAGTGKTYTIANLYLRLVLGHATQALPVSSILVLTFTNAATAELRERLLARLNTAYRAFLLGKSDDQFIQALIDASDNLERDRLRLNSASQEMDDAAIFTIHGFCQKVLQEYAFESNTDYEYRFELDDSSFVQQACNDFWRCHVVDLPIAELNQFLSLWPSPQGLLAALRPLLARDLATEPAATLQQQHQAAEEEYLQRVHELKTWWQAESISTLLLQAKLRKNTLLAKEAFHQEFNEFIASDQIEYQRGKDGWNLLFPEKIENAKTKSSEHIDLRQFERFERLHQLQISLRSLFQRYYTVLALDFIKQHLNQAKSLANVLTPDDLLSRLRQSLESNAGAPVLLSRLRQSYPIALVDEFQDTDDVQFSIFKTIYPFAAIQKNQRIPAFALVMIGDPKQAIYSFRGGDIYTYIAAKRQVPECRHYTLGKNWRSQPSLVSAVNALFQFNQDAFLQKADIPFIAVDATQDPVNLYLENEQINPVELHLLTTDEPPPWSQVQAGLANYCASRIAQMLALGKVNQTPVQASDVCILVRDRFEAEVMKRALSERNVDSVYLSRETVFDSDVAYSIYLCMEAIMHCQDERRVKAVLLDSLFSYSGTELHQVTQNLAQWQDVLANFQQANGLWHDKGISAALFFLYESLAMASRQAMYSRNIYRVLTDLRHLVELLSVQAKTHVGMGQLLQWYKETLAHPNPGGDIQQRLETDNQLVQIVTMHAAKGLQYPLVFIPFASRYKEAGPAFYHDQDNKLQLAWQQDEATAEQRNKERLAEDIRLFYVALTRAETYCYVGVWNNRKGNSRKKSGFSQTALGYLLGMGNHAEPEQLSCEQILQGAANCFAGEEVSIVAFNNTEDEPGLLKRPPQDADAGAEPLQQPLLAKPFSQVWFLTSYSAIARQALESDHSAGAKASDELDMGLGPGSTEAAIPAALEPELPVRFSFVKGAQAGSYLHDVLENSDFTKASELDTNSLEIATKYGFIKEQVDGVSVWLQETLATPLTMQGAAATFCLRDISEQNKLPEMEFYLPLEHVTEQDFNQLLQQYYPDELGYYAINKLNGMMKGFLDLVFFHKGKFHVADYKSNHLGNSFEAYSGEAIGQSMQEHDYFLQAVLYAVAMHRFLRSRINNYRYGQHFAGTWYLYLRGMSPAKPGYGVYFFKPERALVEALDNLFCGETADSAEVV